MGGSTTTNYQSQVIDNMNSLTGNTLSTTDNVTYTDGATGIKYIVTGYQYQEGQQLQPQIQLQQQLIKPFLIY